MTALASGKLTPISTAGTATSSSIGFALNHSSVGTVAAVSGDASDDPPSAMTSASIPATSASASPASVATTSSPWLTMNQLAGCVVRRRMPPPSSDPAPMPTRITVSNSENTARKPPSRMLKWRNQRISMPSAASPVIASAMAVQITAESR